jgi:hypothetical protein
MRYAHNKPIGTIAGTQVPVYELADGCITTTPPFEVFVVVCEQAYANFYRIVGAFPTQEEADAFVAEEGRYRVERVTRPDTLTRS